MNALRSISDFIRDVLKEKAAKQNLAGALVVLLTVGLCAVIWRVVGPEQTQTHHSSGCDNPGDLTSTVLPNLDPQWVTIVENPCFDVGLLVTSLVDLIPTDEQSQLQAFLKRLDGLVARLNEVQGVVECGYTTDRLAVGLYQDREHPWAVGVVGILRGDVDAMLEVSDCFLFSQVLPLTTTRVEPSVTAEPAAARPRVDGAQPTLCSSALLRRVGSEAYTILYAGSSQALCQALADGVRSSEGPAPTPPPTAAWTPTSTPTEIGAGPTTAPTGEAVPGTPADDRARVAVVLEPTPGVAVREGPGLTYREIARVSRGEFGTVTCFTEGVYVAGPFGESQYWDRVSIGGKTGYVSDAFLDTGSDIDVVSRPCTVEERTAFLTGIVTADPDVALRASPDVAGAELGRVPAGTRLRVLCIAEGTAVLGDSRWAHVETDKATGFVSLAYLSIDGDLTVVSRPC